MSARYVVYTDGACSGNPGPGGWAWVRADGSGEGYGGEQATTNNRMELMAAIEALRAIRSALGSGTPAQGEIEVRTDSQYVKNGVTSWIASWKRNGWRTAAKAPVKNRDLWEILDALSSDLRVAWTWVEGHAGVELNERCDALARRGVAEFGDPRARPSR